jgi:hypothetical protein
MQRKTKAQWTLGIAIGVFSLVSMGWAAPIGYVDPDGYECVAPCPYADHTQCPEPAEDWRYVGRTSETSTTAAGGGQPAASSSIAVNQVIRKNILVTAQPAAKPRKQAPAAQPAAAPEAETKPAPFYEQMPGMGRLSSGSADMFYNKWEVGESDGSTIGFNPSITWGEEAELTLTAPLHLILPDEGDNIFAVGLDGAYKRPLTGKLDKFAAGVHAYGMGYFGGDDTASNFGGGPFLSWTYRIDPKWLASAGGLLEITKPDEGDTFVEIVPAVNLGYNVSDDLALNAYVIYYKNLDSDVDDDAYADLGLDVQWIKGGWALAGGIKTSAGLDNVDSTEIHLGSSWIF